VAVEAAQEISINNSDSVYPSIVLCDDPLGSGGELRAAADMTSNALLRLRDGAKVTLEGGLILRGAPGVPVRGVYVDNSTFTMKGGEILGNNSSDNLQGGGVCVDNSTFTMSGGEISGNKGNLGGGVYVTYSTFTMSGGEISGNTASLTVGGGVCVENSTFTMSGGEISGNTASSSGGGVRIRDGEDGGFTRFAKTGGTIYGYDDTNDPMCNTVKNSSGAIVGNKGHAVYYDSTYRKETTVGPGVKLYYNDPANGASGW
jgi:hypothetical protein